MSSTDDDAITMTIHSARDDEVKAFSIYNKSIIN